MSFFRKDSYDGRTLFHASNSYEYLKRLDHKNHFELECAYFVQCFSNHLVTHSNLNSMEFDAPPPGFLDLPTALQLKGLKTAPAAGKQT